MTRASDTAKILSGGAVFNEDSADVDFRVESNGNANMLLVNGGNDNVAVGSVSGTAATFNVNAGGSDGAGAYRILNTTDGVTTNFVVRTDNSASTNVVLIGPETSSALAFMMGGSEKMRIDTGSRLAFGNTDTNAKITVSQDGSSLNIMRLQNTDGGHSCTYIQFANSGNNSSGNITQTGSNTVAYNTSSDYRLKENISYNFDATTRLKQLKPARFNFIDDGTDKTMDGFIAHEVSSIVPEAVNGTKDATRDIGTIKDIDGNITAKNAPQAQANTDEKETWEKTGTENIYQGIDLGKLVPLLVKTIQELEARIVVLENT